MRRYIDLLTGLYRSISSIWLMGSRASSTERPESDWDLLAFADGGALGEMQGDPRRAHLGLTSCWLLTAIDSSSHGSMKARSAQNLASSEKSVGHRYAPMAAGSSARAAREPDVG